MQSAILFGLSNTVDTTTQQIRAHCPSESCQWEPFLSLGVCSSCSDITHFLVTNTTNYPSTAPHSVQVIEFMQTNPGLELVTGAVTAYRLPNGLYLEDGESQQGVPVLGLVTLGTSNRSNRRSHFRNNEALLLVVNHVAAINPALATPSGNRSFTAMECGLFYCVMNVTSQVKNGTISEMTRALPLDISPGSHQPLDSSIPDPSPMSLDSHGVQYPSTDSGSCPESSTSRRLPLTL